jgi:hypothetical protein
MIYTLYWMQGDIEYFLIGELESLTLIYMNYLVEQNYCDSARLIDKEGRNCTSLLEQIVETGKSIINLELYLQLRYLNVVLQRSSGTLTVLIPGQGFKWDANEPEVIVERAKYFPLEKRADVYLIDTRFWDSWNQTAYEHYIEKGWKVRC